MLDLHASKIVAQFGFSSVAAVVCLTLFTSVAAAVLSRSYYTIITPACKRYRSVAQTQPILVPSPLAKTSASQADPERDNSTSQLTLLPPRLQLPMPYSLFCAVIGGETLSTVKIKGTQTVGELKNKIKSTAGLVSAAHSLTLYHVDLDIASDGAYLHAMRTISRSTTCAQVIHDLLPNTADPKQEELINPSHELSAIFSPAPARHRIHILVQLPPGESQLMIPCAIAEVTS